MSTYEYSHPAYTGPKPPVPPSAPGVYICTETKKYTYGRNVFRYKDGAEILKRFSGRVKVFYDFDEFTDYSGMGFDEQEKLLKKLISD